MKRKLPVLTGGKITERTLFAVVSLGTRSRKMPKGLKLSAVLSFTHTNSGFGWL